MSRKRQKITRLYQRGLKCSYCGKLKFFYANEIAVMNSSPGNRIQCQNCGHTHWDECPKSKRVKELKALTALELSSKRSKQGIRFM